MPTPDELRELANLYEKRAAVELEAAALDEAIAAMEARLQMANGGRTIRSMRLESNATPAVKRAAGRSRRKHPAQAKLYAKGVTITALATKLKETRARVSSWMSADDEANRAIPRHHAETLRDLYGIPLSAWKRIAD